MAMAHSPMKNERWVWIFAAVLGMGFWIWRAVVAPLPFYSFQSDPELHYFINSLLLANGLPIEHTDHPGTALQWLGAVMARCLGLHLSDVFDPAAIQRFYLVWRVIAFASLLGTGAWLARRLQGRGAWAVAALVLLAAFDYQTLVYWLTFTPESAFFVLYLPVALFGLDRCRTPEKCTLRASLWLAVLLGFVTTLKLTLWPVTLFVLVQLAAAGTTATPTPAWRRFLALTLTSLLTYVIVASLFAKDRAAPWRWMLRLVEHTGRYGAARSGEGFFPPWAMGWEAIQRALSLQDFTTLPVFVAVVALAVWSLRSRKTPPDRPARVLAVGFLCTALLLLVMFFKHPYQGKYLMPVSVLLLLFVAALIDSARLPSRRAQVILCLVFGLSAANAVLTQKILFDHTLARAQRVNARIDAWLASTPHDALIFSSRLPHPLPAFKEALRPPIVAAYVQRFGRVELTGTYSLEFQRVARATLPPLPGVQRAISFLNTPTPDPHWRLVESVPADDLYIYLPATP